jgi:hypothetical protein
MGRSARSKAMVANDGTGLPATLEEGAAVSLRLPPDGLRVLRSSAEREETAEAEESAEPKPA